MYSQYRGRSGPHSIHDARQHAWALLFFGPGAPPPRMRPHPALLPDLPEPVMPRRPSLLVGLARLLRRHAFADAAASGDVLESGETSAHQGGPQGRPAAAHAHGAGRKETLAA